MKRVFTLLLALSIVASMGILAPLSAAGPEAEAQSVILLIGDGMSLTQTYSAEIFAQEVLGTELSMTKIDNLAVTTTHAADSMVPDSAAAGTSIHSGFKANARAINVLPDGTWAYSIGQAAHAAGKSVGVISTARITHATPATVYGHDVERNEENLFASQLVEFAPEVVLGGGARYFLPEDDGGRRDDGRNLIDEMVEMGYTNVTNADELLAVDAASTDYLVGLFTSSHMSYEIDRVNAELDQPSLAEMTAMALDVLGNNPEGFFVSIESGRIDHACHDHDIAGSIWDTLAFDAAVQVALDYQAEHPEVLVIVTADHETGGMSLGHGTEYFTSFANLADITCSQSALDYMIGDDPDNAVALAEECGLVLNEEQIEMLEMYPADADEIEGVNLGYAYSWGHYVFAMVEAEMAGIEFGPWAHTGVPVVTYAVGPGAEMFTGTIDNVDIAQYAATLLGVTLEAPAMPK